MCLDIVTWSIEDTKEAKPKIKRGWKAFCEYKGDGLYSQMTYLRSTKAYPINKWIEDSEGGFTSGNYHRYRVGFHVFTTLASVKSWLNGLNWHGDVKMCVIRQVEYSHVVAEGEQEELKVAVAKRMKILKKV